MIPLDSFEDGTLFLTVSGVGYYLYDGILREHLFTTVTL